MTEKHLHIEITSDFNCPWCEVGRHRLDKALKALPPTVSYEIYWKPFFLYKIPADGLSWTDHMQKRWGLFFYSSLILYFNPMFPSLGSSNPVWYVSMANEVEAEGIDIKHYCSKFVNTVDPHRICELAYEKLGWKAGRALHDRLMKAYFSEATDIMDPAILLAEGVKVGLDEETIQKMLADKDGKQRFEKDVIKKQMRARINGVPYFVINGCVF